MVDILHRIAVQNVTPEDASATVRTLPGIASWWIEKTTGDPEKGGHLKFADFIEADVLESGPHRVVWQVTAGHDEWIGTHISYDFTTDEDYTVVLFKQEGWAKPSEFMHHCSTKWGSFMLSLKQYLETGQGAPTPRDVPIDNWA